jgi:type II secretory pathway pseudopilin PulG
MHSPPTRRRSRRSPVCRAEEGYILVAVIFMLALLIIAMAVAAPKVAKEIQRDRELETMQRGKQYIRALRLYYRKFTAYPPSVDALLKAPGPGNLRFLRKKYIDPTTGKDEWKPIHFGQNKAPTAMGFFGQPLAGSTLAGIGPGGAAGIAGASPAGGAFMNPGGTTGASGTTGSTDSLGASGASGQTGDSGGAASSGPAFGGLGIVGFSPNSPKQSILVYKKKNHYNEWEFVYDPATERTMVGGNAGTIGQPVANPNGVNQTPTTGTNSITSQPTQNPTPQ